VSKKAELQSNERRQLLKIVGAFFVGNAIGIHPAFAATLPTDQERKTFAAFLDVLLPRDEHSGSASDLGIDVKLRAFSETDDNYHKLIKFGCQWLNMTGGPPFSELESQQQIALVEWMTTSDWNQIPRRFYTLVRQTAIELYYSEPATWAGTAIDSPPQPLGYMPPWQ